MDNVLPLVVVIIFGLIAATLIGRHSLRLYHRKEARKYLDLYRQTDKWFDPNLTFKARDANAPSLETFPQHLWGSVVYHLNYGGNLKADINDSYKEARYIGSSLEELQSLDRKRKRWVAMRALHTLREMSDYDFCTDDLKWFYYDLKDHGPNLKSLGTSASEILAHVSQNSNSYEAIVRIYQYLEEIGINMIQERKDNPNEDWVRVVEWDLERNQRKSASA